MANSTQKWRSKSGSIPWKPQAGRDSLKTQLATPTVCQKCVDNNQHLCGQLHVDEREFSQFHTPGYADILQNAFASAAGILAVNPLIATLCEPYSQAVHVVPSGFDPDRFLRLQGFQETRPFRFLFAGLTDEYMKGFQVLLQACQMLWQVRQDFELHVTADDSNHSHKEPSFVIEDGRTKTRFRR